MKRAAVVTAMNLFFRGVGLFESGVWQQAILDAPVPLVSYRTLADRVGAWPEYVLVLVTVLALGFSVVTLRRRRNRPDVSGV